MGRFKGIVFDLDGTLVHTEVNFTKMKEKMIGVLEAHGAPKGTLIPTMTTVVILEHARKYWDEAGKPEAERRWLEDEMTRLMDEGEMEAIGTLKPIPGASEAVRELRARGYKLAILTRSHHAYAQAAIEALGVGDCFDVVLGRGETPQPKPYADAMVYSARALGLGLDEVFLVGDHHLDSTCAVNAGCAFIGVATGLRPDRAWEVNKPELILASVSDLPRYLAESDA